MRKRGSVVLFFSAILAGCGSPSTQEQEGAQSNAAGGGEKELAAVDPCSLITSDEVAAATEQKIAAAKAEGDTCTYEGEDAQASSVTVTVKRQGAAEEMEGVRGAAKILGSIGGQMAGEKGAPGDVGKLLSQGGTAGNLGDESLFDVNQQLHVRKGGTYIAVAPPIMRSRMSGGSPMLSGEQKRKMATDIAQKALTRL